MDKILANKHILSFVLLGSAFSFALYQLKKKINFSYLIFSKKWFSEISIMWPGQAFSLEIKKILCQTKSKYQNILVFESKNYGNVLVLDGVIQLTEKDEFAYHEMMTHIPLSIHENAKNVLIIGGGDGFMIREVCKYKNVKNIDLCEIDDKVIDLCKKYFSHLNDAFNDKRVNIFVEDASNFLDNYKDTYDVIIIDCSDPMGPAEVLFTQNFYQKVYNALKSNGIVVSQCESIWIHVQTIKKMIEFTKKIFKVVKYANISIPSYPCGCIGILCCSKDENMDLSKPKRKLDFKDLKYYNFETHVGSFQLPSFVKNEIENLEN